MMTTRFARLRSPLLAIGPLMLLGLACPASNTPASSESSSGSSETAPQGDLIALLPADAATIGWIDLEQLRTSSLFSMFVSDDGRLSSSEDLNEFITETGIDPRNDLHRMAFVFGNPTQPGSWEQGGFVVQATFDAGMAREKLAELPTEEYGGSTIYHIAGWQQRRGDDDATNPEDEETDIDVEGFVTLLDDQTVAFGSASALRGIIDVASGGAASARSNSRLMSLLEDVTAGSQLWFVSAHDDMFTDLPAGDDNPMSQLPWDKIKSLIVAANLADGIDLKLRGRTASKQDAKLLGDSLNGMLALGKMMLQSNDPALFEILDAGVEAGSNGQDVTVRAELSLEDIQAIQAFVETQFGEAMSGREAA